jgi:hypothetical protein
MHVREYTPRELYSIFTSSGYEVDACKTEYVFPGYSVDYALSILKSVNAPRMSGTMIWY